MAKATDVQEPKRFLASTFYLSLGLTFIWALVGGLVAGYIIALNVHADARQQVVSDMTIVSKTSKQQ